jgi:uncharacterized repeat protein (TIGR01451 family)
MGKSHVGMANELAVVAANDLAVVVQDSPDVVLLGESLVYEVWITNTGPERATGVILTNQLPEAASFLQVDTTRGACGHVNGTVRCDLGTLAAGESVRVRITAQAMAPGEVTDWASVGRAENDGFPGNNSATALSTFAAPLIMTTNVLEFEGSGANHVVNVSVHLSAPISRPVSVNYATSNNTAVAGADYLPVSGTLTFAPGVTNLFIPITFVGDLLDEGLETFLVVLSEPTNGTLVHSQARVRIEDDDPTPEVSVADVNLVEGAPGTTNEMVFEISLSAPSGLTASVEFTTQDGTAAAPADYLTTFGKAVFAPGTTRQTVRVPVRGDRRYETNETFVLVLSNAVSCFVKRASATATILDDDDGELHRFSWDWISSPQTVGEPVQATLTAWNGRNERATNYAGAVTLRAVAESREFVTGQGTNIWEFPLASEFHDARTQVLLEPEELGGPGRLTALGLELVSAPGQTLSN